jgi:hypothetical protein
VFNWHFTGTRDCLRTNDRRASRRIGTEEACLHRTKGKIHYSAL